MSGRLATNMNSHSYRPRSSSWLREVASDDCPASSSTWNSDFGLGQWIGLRDNLQENSGKPHVSWENLWFPVKIFPTKPIHWLGNSQQLFLQIAVHLPMYRSTSLPIHLSIYQSILPHCILVVSCSIHLSNCLCRSSMLYGVSFTWH